MHLKRRLEHLPDRFGQPASAAFRLLQGDSGKHDDKFIFTQAADRRLLAGQLAQPFAHSSQNLISAIVAEDSIHGLKMVDVH